MKLYEYSPAWDLSTIPDDALRSEWASRNARKRKTYTGGIYWAKHNPDWPGCRCVDCIRRRLAEARSR